MNDNNKKLFPPPFHCIVRRRVTRKRGAKQLTPAATVKIIIRANVKILFGFVASARETNTIANVMSVRMRKAAERRG